MKFEEILPALLQGKRIGRSFWSEDKYVYAIEGEISFLQQNGYVYIFCIDDFKADDWEVIKGPRKVKLRYLTKGQYWNWARKNCHNVCDDCIFKNVVCVEWHDKYWIDHKDLYSDKFLDQEIEIE